MVNGITINPTASQAVTLRLSRSSDTDRRESFPPLSERERRQAARLTDVNRRQAFVTGRWLARQAVADSLGQPDLLSCIEIIGHSPEETTSRPVVHRDGWPIDVCVSISHTRNTVIAAVTGSEGGVGIDVTPIERPRAAFLNCWMKERERSQIMDSDSPALAAAKNWAAREAAFKLTQQDEVFRPADWSVSFDADRCSVIHCGRRLPAHVRFVRIPGDLLLAIATSDNCVAPLQFSLLHFQGYPA